MINSQELIASTYEIQTVYQNIDNPIKTNLNCYNYRVEIITDNGIIKLIDDQIYWRPEIRGISFLKLISYETEKPIVLDSIQFKVKPYGLPRIGLNMKMRHSGIGDYKSVQLIFELKEKDEYLKLKSKVKIWSFEMNVSLEKLDGEIETYKFISDNEKIPKDFEIVKNKLGLGDVLKVEIKKVKITCDWMKEVKYYDEYLRDIPGYTLQWIWKIR